jgi:hypothetical protein
MNGGFRLNWPTGLKRTATRVRWFQRFSQLKAGLDLQQVSDSLGEPYATVYRWADTFGYPFPDRRRRGRVSTTQWDSVEWGQRDAVIARDLGVSRERVRQVRASRGMGPSEHRAAVQRFEQFVAAESQRLHGMPIAQIVEEYGSSISPQIARRIVRAAGIRAHDPESRWRSVDWRLTNRDLAVVWGTSAKYIANVRARLGVGPSQWDARSTRNITEPTYVAALAKEQERADSMGKRPATTPSPEQPHQIAEPQVLAGHAQ